MSRVFITGDLHGHIDIRKLTEYNFPEGQTLTKNDYVIVCGDFGIGFDKNLYTRSQPIGERSAHQTDSSDDTDSATHITSGDCAAISGRLSTQTA